MADSQENKGTAANPQAQPTSANDQPTDQSPAKAKEHGGPKGLEPTRYGDWEQNGRCTDF